jgi:hypothetical protein
METIKRRIVIDEERQITLRLPSRVQTGEADIVVVIAPVASRATRRSVNLNRHAGALKLTEDALAYQRRVRGEWR